VPIILGWFVNAAAGKETRRRVGGEMQLAKRGVTLTMHDSQFRATVSA
jgi:hypothetical protein